MQLYGTINLILRGVAYGQQSKLGKLKVKIVHEIEG